MKELLKEPLMPYVTLEECLGFEPDREETHTTSPFVNAVLKAMHVVRPSTARNVARYLDLEERNLSGALRIATGYTYLELRYRWILNRLDAMRQDKKHVVTDETARELGFADHSALSRFLRNRKTQEALASEGPQRHAKPCPGRTKFGA